MNTQAPKFFFSLVLVEVVFSVDEEPMARKIQFFSKSDEETFPSRRLLQIQNTAALQIKNMVDSADSFKVLEASILGLHPLGQMTDEEFYGPQGVEGEQDEAAPAEELPGPQTGAQGDSDANVTPIRK